MAAVREPTCPQVAQLILEAEMIRRRSTSAPLRGLFVEVIGLLLFSRVASAQPVAGYIGAGPGIYINDFTSGGLFQFAGGADLAATRFVSFGSDVGLLVGGGDASMPFAFSASAHIPTVGGFDPFFR